MSAVLTLPVAADVLAVDAAKSAIAVRVAGIDQDALSSFDAARLAGILEAAMPVVEGWAAVTAADAVPDADELDDFATAFAAVGEALDGLGGLPA